METLRTETSEGVREIVLCRPEAYDTITLLCKQTVENTGFASSPALGTLFDGIARHTQEGLDFVRCAEEVGFRHVVRERDDPFGDYGSRRR